MPKVIVSYLSGDQPPLGQTVANAISSKFGHGVGVNGVASVIRPGDDYEDAITHAVESCDALVLVVGHQWGTAVNWEDEANYDRVAILHALNHKKRIIPVLVDGAKIPANLPGEMAKLGRRSAIEVQSASSNAGITQLLNVISEFVGAMPQYPPQQQMPQQPPYQQQYRPPQQQQMPQYPPQQQMPQQPPYQQQYRPPQQQQMPQYPQQQPYGVPSRPNIDMGAMMIPAIVGGIAFAVYYLLSFEALINADSEFAYALVDGFLLAIAVVVLGRALPGWMNINSSAITVSGIGAGVVSALSILMFFDSGDGDIANFITRAGLAGIVAFAYSEYFPSNGYYNRRLNQQMTIMVAIGVFITQYIVAEIGTGIIEDASTLSGVRFSFAIVGAIAGALLASILYIGLSYSPPSQTPPPNNYYGGQQPPRY